MIKQIKNKKGFTTIELLIVVSIISVLSGVVYFIYDSVSDKRQVNSELKNIEILVGQLKNSTISSTYHNVSNATLLDYGITYNSNFSSFNINGTSHKSFEIDYKDLNSRQCSDFALKTSGFKGEYILTRKVNGKIINNSPTTIASECAKDLNTVNLEFEGLILPQVAQITPGIPKPPPVYAGPGTFVPDLPDRVEIPTNLNQVSKTVGLPEIPIKGAYVPPIGLTDNPSIVPGGNIFDTSGYVKPVYDDKPPPPVISGADNTNFRPATPTPPPPPAPPAPPDDIVLNFKTVCHSLIQPSCFARSGTYSAKISSFNGEHFRRWALGFGPSICPYPYAASGVFITLNDLDSSYQATYNSNNWFPPFIPTSSLAENTFVTNKGVLSISITCSGFN